MRRALTIAVMTLAVAACGALRPGLTVRRDAQVPVPPRLVLLLGAATNIASATTNRDAIVGHWTYTYTNAAIQAPPGWMVEEVEPGRYLYTLPGRFAFAAAIEPVVTTMTNAASGVLAYANGTLAEHIHTSVVERLSGLRPSAETKRTGSGWPDFMFGTNRFAWAWNSNFWARSARGWNAIAVATWMDDYKTTSGLGAQVGNVVSVDEDFFAASDYGRVLSPTNAWVYRVITAATNARTVAVRPSGGWSNSPVAVASVQNAVWYQGAGLMISPIHIITSGHMLWRHDTNRWYRFYTTNGVAIDRKVLGVAQINTSASCEYVLSGSSEWSIGVFAPLAGGVEIPYMRCLPPGVMTNKWSWPTNVTYISYNQDHYFRVTGMGLDSEWATPATRGGDSGSPTMVLMGEELVWAGAALTYADTNCINEAMMWLSRTNGGLPEYQLDLIDVSGFPDL